MLPNMFLFVFLPSPPCGPNTSSSGAAMIGSPWRRSIHADGKKGHTPPPTPPPPHPHTHTPEYMISFLYDLLYCFSAKCDFKLETT